MNYFQSVYRISTILAFLLGVAAIIFTQFAIPTLYGFDGYFHIRMAEFIKNSGPIYDFHWAKFSIFSTHFSDKSFLYHLILIPFTFVSNIFLGAKLSACFFAILFLFVFFIVLRKYCVRFLIPIFIVASILSSSFMSALSMPRPMNFAIILSLLAVYFLIEGKLWGIFIVTVLYCLSHISGPYLLFYALLTEIIRFFAKREFYLKSIVVVFLSIIVSYLIHPNFPNNFLAFYLDGILVPIYAFKGKLEMGSELLPLTTKQVLFSYPLVIFGLLFLLFLAIFARPRTKFSTQVLFAYSALFIILSFIASRFFIHSYPIYLLLLASYTSDYFQDKSNLRIYQKNKILASVSIVTLCISLSLFGLSTWKNIRCISAIMEETKYSCEQMGEWMSKNIPTGELIFHTDWYDGTAFIGLNPKNDYLVCLHPIYMYWGAPEVYNLYRNLSHGRTRDPYSILRYVFKVKYGYIRKGYGLLGQIRGDSRFKILTEGDKALVFRLD